ncbi:MAG: UvrD-helicase domain-containing protein [Anaeroplasmataceae bacterium]|nr:UvrD-helicase domain-containing protein [Anaeroplasmataceae bacterium]
MALFSIVKRKNKKVNKTENIEIISKNEEPKEVKQILSIYDEYEKILGQDRFISRKDMLSFSLKYEEDIKFLCELDKRELLLGICKDTPYDEVKNKLNILRNIDVNIEKRNHYYVENEKNKYKSYFDTILNSCDPNILLDDDQRNCIVYDEDYSLVIAGAGAGKTTTIAAKVKYLVDKKGILPEEILIVSFTNKAVDELKERVNKQLNISCPITTFHSAGIAIIKKDKPNEKIQAVSEGFLYVAVRDYLKDGIKMNPSLIDKVILLFGTYFETPFQEGSLKDFFTYLSRSDFSTMKSNLGEFNQQIIDKRTKKLYTINDERVRSQQEVQIANFLYINNIDYKYEDSYEFNMQNSDKIYTPDFHIFQNNLNYYVEHFALSQKGENSRFTEFEIQKYKKAINDKVKLHRAKGTNLIYTWSKYNDGRSLLEHLEEELCKAGFVLKRKSTEEIFDKLSANEENKYIAPLIKLLCLFISNFKVNGYNESTFAKMKNDMDNVRTNLFLDLAYGAYLFYQQRLSTANRVDFSDMINESARLLQQKKELKEKLPFKYIIVDEYQDISRQRFDLTKALSDVCDAKIVAVGDDWQSIYAFSGSDITLFTQFKEKMGYAKELKIVKTYRNPQEVIDIAGNFVQENTSQIKKELISPKHIDKPVVIYSYNDDYQDLKEKGFKNEMEARAKMIEDVIGKVVSYNTVEGKSKKSSILLIGRYNFDAHKLGNTKYFCYDENKKTISSNKYPNVNIEFLTAHSSKGLGYDNVIIINAIDTLFGFPAQLEIDPVLKLVIQEDSAIEYAEERRLFYVAMTRTKNRVFIVAPSTRPSQFILELKEKYSKVELVGELNPKYKYINNKICPICGYPLQLKYNPNYGLRLYMCTNEPEICEFMTNDIHGGKMAICKCDSCKDGYLIVKQSKTNAYFLGCTNYYSINCTRQISKSEYYRKHNLVDKEFDLNELINKQVSIKNNDNETLAIHDSCVEAKTEIEPKEATIAIDLNEFQKFYDALLEYRNLKASRPGRRFYVLPEEIIYTIYKEMPLTIKELANIKGIGEIKLERYGEDLISIINNHLNLKEIPRPIVSRAQDNRELIGNKWTSSEEKQLIEEFSHGMKMPEIAKIHSRTTGGIRARLKKLGVIE